MDLVGHEPVLHTSRMYLPETGCTTLVMPMIGEPGNNNSVLVYDLRQDPSPFMDLDVEGLRRSPVHPGRGFIGGCGVATGQICEDQQVSGSCTPEDSR